MQNESLLLAYILVMIAMAISWKNRLEIEKDILGASVRATLQLIAVGFVLEWILTIDRMLYLVLILVVMTAVAGWVSGNRGRPLPYSHAIAWFSIAFGSFATFGVLWYAGVIQSEARFAIPLGGMIIGNSMKAASLAMNRLLAETEHRRRQIETLLALGASPKQAMEQTVRQAAKAALIPTIDTLKTVGLVHLPGIMTGYIVAGGSPLTAVKYQLAIMYMLTGASAMTCLATVLLAYRGCFNKSEQLILDRSF